MKKFYSNTDQVKKALKINSFRELSKDKVCEFVSLIPNMDVEVAKEIINQFPEYVSFAKCMLSELGSMCSNALTSAKDGMKETLTAQQYVIDSLRNQLDTDTISDEQRESINCKIVEISCNVMQINKDYNKMIENVVKTCVFGCMFVVGIGAAILGVNCKVKSLPEIGN